MRRLALLLLAAAPGWAQINSQVASLGGAPTVTAPARVQVPLSSLTELEHRFNTKLATLGGVNDPIDMLGTTRGLYLEGYGAVFTTEMSLLLTPGISPFKQTITEQEKVQVHQRKTERLPKLKQAMQEFLRTAAMHLTQMPDNQEFVVAVRLDYYKWEDTLGPPGLIVMKADRKSAATNNFKLEEQ